MKKLTVKVGAKYERLTVESVELAYGRGQQSQAVCNCICGTTGYKVSVYKLQSGHTRSCGCLQKEATKERNYKHGHAGRNRVSPSYKSWSKMIERCYDPNCKDYPRYGGRGITVCDRWRGEGGFTNFLADLGECPTIMHKDGKTREYTIDREDSDGNYEPDNCSWQDKIYQARGGRKYTEEQAREIKRLLKNGLSKQVIAERAGVPVFIVESVNRGDSWAWVTLNGTSVPAPYSVSNVDEDDLFSILGEIDVEEKTLR